MYVFDGDEIVSTDQEKVMEMSRASWVNVRKNLGAANDNAPFETRLAA